MKRIFIFLFSVLFFSLIASALFAEDEKKTKEPWPPPTSELLPEPILDEVVPITRLPVDTESITITASTN